MLNICKNFKRGKVKSKVAHFLPIAKARGIRVRVLMMKMATNTFDRPLVLENDEDIQNFLHNRAIDFENLLKSRTYLVVDEEQFENPAFSLDKLTIYAYISLAVKVFTVPETTSNRQRQQSDGFSAKEHGKQISNFPCYLIGQLARNSNVT